MYIPTLTCSLPMPPHFPEPISCPSNLTPVVSVAYSSTHPLYISPLFRTIPPSISPFFLLLSLTLLLHLAHDEVSPLCPWVGENPLWQKVFVCACGYCRVCNMIASTCLVLYMCVSTVCCLCVWPSLACWSDRHQGCAVTAGEEMIYLSGGWRTGRQIQWTDKCTVLLVG